MHPSTTDKCPLTDYSSMSDRKFTLIELHIDGETQFGPKTISDALPIGADDDTTAAEATEDDDAITGDDDATDDSSGGKAIGVLIGLAVLAGIAIAAKKFRGGDDEELEEFDEPDVVIN